MELILIVLISVIAVLLFALGYLIYRIRSSSSLKLGEDSDSKGALKNAQDQNAHLESIGIKEEEISNLKKKIKDLQNEIEDYEDDIEDVTKRLNNLKSENSELQDRIGSDERRIKKLSGELNEKEELLLEKIEQLEVNNTALRFIQEILQAKTDSSELRKNHFLKVDNLVSYINDRVQNELKKGMELTEDDFSPEEEKTIKYLIGGELSKWSLQQKKDWIQGKKTIAFVGEFSAGKTSIVNRILSQDDPSIPLLPVSAKATTAIPTYITGSLMTGYRVVSPDGLLKVISEKTFKMVSKEVLEQVRGLSSLIKYFVMEYENPNLRNLSILDTPGFNSNDSEDAVRTIEVINECDALFWVFDVNAGTVNKSSISLIKEKLHRDLYIVINKVDTKADSEVDKVEALIRKTLSDAAVPIKSVIRFSSKAPLESIMNPILDVAKSKDEDSYIDVLENAFKSTIKELEDEVHKLKSQRDSQSDEVNQTNSNFNNLLTLMRTECDELTQIPRKRTNLFGEERYKMSKSEYEDLVRRLGVIVEEKIKNLSTLYEESKNTTVEFQKISSSYERKKLGLAQLTESLEKITKKMSALITTQTKQK